MKTERIINLFAFLNFPVALFFLVLVTPPALRGLYDDWVVVAYLYIVFSFILFFKKLKPKLRRVSKNG